MLENDYYIAVRHGEIDRMNDSILGSGSDLPLNERGLNQAHELARYISNNLKYLSVILSSPLLRARQTSEIIANHYTPQLPIIFEPCIQAQNFGILEGQRVSIAREQEIYKPYLYEFIPENERYCSIPPGGESLKELAERSVKLFTDLNKRVCSKDVLIVTHQSVLRAIHGKLKNIPPHKWDSKVTIPYSDCLAISPRLDTILQGSLITNSFKEV